MNNSNRKLLKGGEIEQRKRQGHTREMFVKCEMKNKCYGCGGELVVQAHLV